MFDKLSKINVSELKKWNISPNEIAYLKNKILNDKLGLVLNFEEKDENLENYYFGLEEVKELHINPKEKNNHLLIEGDNYYALKALQISGIKVDVIYIDPPYNTGNKDFIYNDNYVNKDDQFKHSKWLSFMKKRLELAKELLADDGVIFVSIDDNEQAYLKVLMDEIFGEENFIACLARETKTGGGRFGKQFIQKDFDYLISYLKNINITNEFKKIKSDWDDYKYEDERGKYTLKHPLDGGSGNKKYIFDVVINDITFKPRTNWSFSKKRIQFMIKNNFLVPKENGIVYIKNYKEWEIEEQMDGYHIVPKESGTWWSSSKLIDKKYNNATASNEIKKIFVNKDIFSYPKPTKLILDLINMINKKNTIVLDFFAGSGTTAQAVMELNEEDGGNRRFILCTNNENDIAKNVARERIYRVIMGNGSKNEKIEWRYSNNKKSLNNNSVKYLKVKHIDKVNGEYEDIINLKKIYQNEFSKNLSIKDFK